MTAATARHVRTYTVTPSPVGELLLVGDGRALTGVYLPGHRRGPQVDQDWRRADEAFLPVVDQLADYFAGTRTTFNLPTAEVGTPFQQRVWAALREIPYGATWSYRTLAERVGSPSAARAVGMANGRNPLSIVVPCHRVVGSSGAMTGYAGGLTAKEQLLSHEARVVAASRAH